MVNYIDALLNADYKQIQNTRDSVKAIYMIRNNTPSVLCFHFDIDGTITANDILTEERSIKNSFANYGYNSVGILNIICTNNIERVGSEIMGHYGCWLVDNRERRLLIYPNQPEDFFGLKGSINNYLSGEYLRVVDDASTSKSRGTIFTVTNILVIINVVVFLITASGGDTTSAQYIFEHGGAEASAIAFQHEYYRLFTCCFLHFGFEHIMNNMLMLFALGQLAEAQIGKLRFFLIYMLGGLGGSLLSYLVNFYITDSLYVVSAGASGCVFAVFGGVVGCGLIEKELRSTLNPKALAIVGIWSIISGFAESGIDNAAHFGGFVFGFIVGVVISIVKGRKV